MVVDDDGVSIYEDKATETLKLVDGNTRLVVFECGVNVGGGTGGGVCLRVLQMAQGA